MSIVFLFFHVAQSHKSNLIKVWYEITQKMDTIPVNPEHSIPARRYVAQFNFSGREQEKKIGQLSGG